MSRVLMLTKDAQIDRRILLEADSLEAAGWQVTILAMPHTVPDADPRVVRLQRAAQRERLVELAAQVWVERERRITLETLLESRGLLPREAIEAFKPDAAQAAALKAERARFIEDVFKELRRIPVRP